VIAATSMPPRITGLRRGYQARCIDIGGDMRLLRPVLCYAAPNRQSPLARHALLLFPEFIFHRHLGTDNTIPH
jgi:hypothetical protein